MFKKIVSELSFSPASVGALSAYASRLQKERSLRGITLLVLAALVVGQLLICLFPSVPPYRSTPNDLMPGGFTSSQSIRETYESGKNDYGNLLALLGLTKDTINHLIPQADLAQQKFGYQVSRMPQSSEYSAYHTSQSTYYLSKLPTPMTPLGEGWTGYSDTYGSFFVSKTSGIIFLERVSSLPQSPIKLSHDIEKHTFPLNPGDQLTINLRATNTSSTPIDSSVVFTFHDLSEYATIPNAGSGIISRDTYEVTWPHQSFAPNETKVFQLQAVVANPLITKPYQVSTPSSQDCTITIVFGNRTDTPVSCPLSAQIELGLQDLPRIHPLTLLILYATLLMICALLYGYTTLQIKEIRIIRKQLNTGEGL